MEIMVSLKSKADALAFAINKATSGDVFDKDKADEIYDYITDKIELPDVETDVSAAYLNNLNEIVSRCGAALSENMKD